MIFSNEHHPIWVQENGINQNAMSFQSADALLIAGAYGLVGAVVLCHRLDLLINLAYYPLLCVAVLLALSISVSTWNRQASLDLTSTVFLLIWIPVSALLNSQWMPSDLGMGTVYYRPSGISAPVWLRQCVLHFLICRYLEEPISFSCLSWVICVNTSIHALALVTKSEKDDALRTSFSYMLNRSPSASVFILTESILVALLATYSLMSTSSFTLMASACFCVMTSTSSTDVMVKLLTVSTFDFFDGLEREYMEVFIFLSDVILHFIFFILGLVTVDIYIIVLTCASMSYPLHDITTRVWKRIQSERTALLPFPRAGIKDLLGHDDVCAVCLSAMRSARVTPCGHLFHGKCLRLCLKEKTVCPLCIQQINVPKPCTYYQ